MFLDTCNLDCILRPLKDTQSYIIKYKLFTPQHAWKAGMDLYLTLILLSPIYYIKVVGYDYPIKLN
jgi:hypothetical protein